MPTVLLVFEFLGTTELLVIALVSLIIFGPRKLPEIGRTIGRGLAEFKRASEDFKRTWEYEVDTERTQNALRSGEQVAATDYAPEAVIPRESLHGDGGEGDDAPDTEAAPTDGHTDGQTIARTPSDFASDRETSADDSALDAASEADSTLGEGMEANSTLGGGDSPALAESTSGGVPRTDEPADATDSLKLRGSDS